MVESGLEQPALPPPGVTLVDQKTVPDHPREQPTGSILAKGLRLLDQDFFDAGRLGDEVEVERQARLDERSVRAMDERQPFEHARVELAAHAQEVSPRWSRRSSGTRRRRPFARRRGAHAGRGALADRHGRSLRGHSTRPDKYGDPPVSPPTGPLSPHRALAFHVPPTPLRARSQPSYQPMTRTNASPVPEPPAPRSPQNAAVEGEPGNGAP